MIPVSSGVGITGIGITQLERRRATGPPSVAVAGPGTCEANPRNTPLLRVEADARVRFEELPRAAPHQMGGRDEALAKARTMALGRLRLQVRVERQRPARRPVASRHVLLEPRVPVRESERAEHLHRRFVERDALVAGTLTVYEPWGLIGTGGERRRRQRRWHDPWMPRLRLVCGVIDVLILAGWSSR